MASGRVRGENVGRAVRNTTTRTDTTGGDTRPSAGAQDLVEIIAASGHGRRTETGRRRRIERRTVGRATKTQRSGTTRDGIDANRRLEKSEWTTLLGNVARRPRPRPRITGPSHPTTTTRIAARGVTPRSPQLRRTASAGTQRQDVQRNDEPLPAPLARPRPLDLQISLPVLSTSRLRSPLVGLAVVGPALSDSSPSLLIVPNSQTKFIVESTAEVVALRAPREMKDETTTLWTGALVHGHGRQLDPILARDHHPAPLLDVLPGLTRALEVEGHLRFPTTSIQGGQEVATIGTSVVAVLISAETTLIAPPWTRTTVVPAPTLTTTVEDCTPRTRQCTARETSSGEESTLDPTFAQNPCQRLLRRCLDLSQPTPFPLVTRRCPSQRSSPPHPIYPPFPRPHYSLSQPDPLPRVRLLHRPFLLHRREPPLLSLAPTTHCQQINPHPSHRPFQSTSDTSTGVLPSSRPSQPSPPAQRRPNHPLCPCLGAHGMTRLPRRVSSSIKTSPRQVSTARTRTTSSVPSLQILPLPTSSPPTRSSVSRISRSTLCSRSWERGRSDSSGSARGAGMMESLGLMRVRQGSRSTRGTSSRSRRSSCTTRAME